MSDLRGHLVGHTLCVFLCGGLGDGWGHATGYSPLDNMSRELGSHLLQVSPAGLGL